jgi:hypothetical protein
MIYLIFLFFLVASAYLFDFVNLKVNHNVFWYLSFLMMFLLVSFRYKLGGDTFNYMRDFESFPTISKLNADFFLGAKYSPLWIVFFSTIKSLSPSFIFLQIIHAILINSVIFWFFNKYSKFRFSCILFYLLYFYFYFNTEILRESIAVCLFLLSVPFYLKKDWRVYFTLSIVAVLFHYSALVLLLFPIFTLKINVIRIYIQIFSAILIIPPLFIGLLPLPIQLYYEEYILYKPNYNGYLYILICFLIFPFFLWKLKNQLNQGGFDFKPFVPIFFLFSFYSFISPSVALRFYNYLIPITTLFVIELIADLMYRKLAKTFYLILFVPLILTYKAKDYFANTSNVLPNTRFSIIWYPYTSIFSKNQKWQINAIDKREKWVDAHFENLVDEFKDLVL